MSPPLAGSPTSLIRPDPVVEAGGEKVREIDGEPMVAMVVAASAAVDAAVAVGPLIEEAVDDHDVRRHYPNGADLVEDFTGKKRQPPAEALPRLLALAEPVTLRERCRLRRLRVIG